MDKVITCDHIWVLGHKDDRSIVRVCALCREIKRPTLRDLSRSIF